MAIVRIGPHQFLQVPDTGAGAAPAAPCRSCGGKTRVKADYEIVPGLRDPLAGPPIKAAEAADPRQRARHVNAFAWLRKQPIPPPARCVGDGVVICGGGKYWPMVVASARMLREHSAVPVQVWHRPAERIEPADLAGVPGVTFHNAADFPHRLLKTWEVKYIALMNCGLSRAISLDADAYFVADPSPLFDAAKGGIAFWQDLHSQDARVRWEAFGLEPSCAEHCAPIQGGHVGLDLSAPATWRAVVLAHWMNQHSDYFYRFGFGDQDMLRAAVAAERTPHTNLGMVGWSHPAYLCALGGRPLVVHRCRAKLTIDRTGHLPGDDAYFAHVAGWLRGSPPDARAR